MKKILPFLLCISLLSGCFSTTTPVETSKPTATPTTTAEAKTAEQLLESYLDAYSSFENNRQVEFGEEKGKIIYTYSTKDTGHFPGFGTIESATLLKKDILELKVKFDDTTLIVSIDTKKSTSTSIVLKHDGEQYVTYTLGTFADLEEKAEQEFDEMFNSILGVWVSKEDNSFITFDFDGYEKKIGFGLLESSFMESCSLVSFDKISDTVYILHVYAPARPATVIDGARDEQYIDIEVGIGNKKLTCTIGEIFKKQTYYYDKESN